MNKHTTQILFCGLIMIGLILRVPFTAIPPILANIAHGMHVNVSLLGTLTTIPLFMFACCSPVAPRIAHRWGIPKTFTGVILILLAGSLSRIINLPGLFIGTTLVGMAIALLNVLMPAAVMEFFPRHVGLMTATYTTVMTCATALMSALAVPITNRSSWKTVILVISGFIILALLAWLPLPAVSRQPAHSSTVHSPIPPTKSPWKTPWAWIMLIFSGLQSFLFYTGLTWLPTMATETGLSQNLAGLLAGLYSLIGIPLALFIPTLVTTLSLRTRRWVMVSFSLLGVVGVALLLHQQASFLYWFTVNCLIGCSAGALFPYMMTAFSLKATTPAQSAELSGMCQSGGYLIAALGPILFGYGHTFFHSWTIVTVCFLGLMIVMTAAVAAVEHTDKII